MATAARDVRIAMGEWAMSKRDWLPVGYCRRQHGS